MGDTLRRISPPREAKQGGERLRGAQVWLLGRLGSPRNSQEMNAIANRVWRPYHVPKSSCPSVLQSLRMGGGKLISNILGDMTLKV